MTKRMCLLMTLLITPFIASGQDRLELSLEKAVAIALERNLDIQLQRVTVNNRAIDIGIANAQYEPSIAGSTSTNSSTTEAATAEQGQAGEQITTSSGQTSLQLSKTEWFGFNWSLEASNSVSDSDAANSFGRRFGGGVQLNFTQQLLQGFSLDRRILREQRYVAESNLRIAKQDLQLQITNVLQQVEEAYWDLVSAIEQLEVNRQGLDLAKQLYEQNKIKIDIGTLAPIELVNAEAQVAQRELSIIQSENAVRAAEDRLKNVLNLPYDDWASTITPADNLEMDQIETNFEIDYERALANRPEMVKDRESLTQAEIDLAVSRNNMLPNLSLNGSYNLSGNASPIDLNGDFVSDTTASNSEVWDEVLDANQTGWSMNIQASWRPWNQQAKLNKARAEVAIRQNQLQSEQTRITIMQDVRAAIRELDSSIKSIRASENSVRYQRENVKAEEQKFQNGISTNYEVNTAQNALTQAESDLITARVGYRKALVTYYKALGLLAENRRITVK